MPDFLIIGAMKAGTTSLYAYLQQHPDIFLSSIKEPCFFAFEGGAPVYSGPGDQARVHVTTIEGYRELFGPAPENAVRGEASTVYMYSSKALDRIARHVPEARLIAVLRNPIERAYSNYLHMVRDGLEETSDFVQALAEEKKRIRNNWDPLWHYAERGFYHRQLARYLDRFDRRQIRIYLYEDLVRDPLRMVQDIFAFLAVDATFVPDLSLRLNVSGFPRSRALASLMNRPNPLKTILRPLIPERLRLGSGRMLRDRNRVRPELPPEAARILIDIYREDILRLQELLGRDLSYWLGRSSEGVSDGEALSS